MQGKRYNNFTVLGAGTRQGYASPMPRWEVRCDCGRVVNRIKNHIVYGRSKSCNGDGCPYRTDTRVDKTGQRYGKLTVIRIVGGWVTRERTKWWVRCDCGVEKKVWTRHLRDDAGTQSCGSSACKDERHGMSGTPEYAIWSKMKKRCQDPSDRYYANYGGRGIKVAAEWERFEEFFSHIGPRPSKKHSIDRIDNDGGYVPGNVRWATPQQQANNHRRNRHITHNGVTKNATQWEKHLGLPRGLIASRIYQGVQDLFGPVALEMVLIHEGEKHTVKVWSVKLGISITALRLRIIKNLPPEKLFFSGNLREYNKRHSPGVYIPAHVRSRMKKKDG